MNTIPEATKRNQEALPVKRPSKWAGVGPVFLSALVYPGAGQLVQRRWLAGGCYILLFSGAFGWLMWRFFGVIKLLYTTADFSKPVGDAPSLGVMGWPFMVTMLVWVANLIDAALGNRPPGSRVRQ